MGFLGSSAGKESYNTGDPGSIPGIRREKLPTSVFLDFPGNSDGKDSACNGADLG